MNTILLILLVPILAIIIGLIVGPFIERDEPAKKAY